MLELSAGFSGWRYQSYIQKALTWSVRGSGIPIYKSKKAVTAYFSIKQLLPFDF